MDKSKIAVGDLVKLNVSNAVGMVMERFPDFRSIPKQIRPLGDFVRFPNEPFFRIELVNGGHILRTTSGIKSVKRIELDLPAGVHLLN